MPAEYKRGIPHLGAEITGAVNGRMSSMSEVTGLEYIDQFPHIVPALEAKRSEALEKRDKARLDAKTQ